MLPAGLTRQVLNKIEIRVLDEFQKLRQFFLFLFSLSLSKHENTVIPRFPIVKHNLLCYLLRDIKMSIKLNF